MKKLQSILVIMLMAVIPMVFVACEDESSKKDKKGTVIGEWKCIGVDRTSEQYGTDSEDWSEENVIWKFTEDGEHYIYYTEDEVEIYDYFLEVSNTTMAETFIVKPVILDDRKNIMFSFEMLCGLFI